MADTKIITLSFEVPAKTVILRFRVPVDCQSESLRRAIKEGQFDGWASQDQKDIVTALLQES